MNVSTATKRPVACPPAPEQYAPTTRVSLETDVDEGELIIINAKNQVIETGKHAGLTTKRAKYSIGAHKQLITKTSQKNADTRIAVCIDSGTKGSLVSCQQHGVVNLLLIDGLTEINYGDVVTVQDIHPTWRPSILLQYYGDETVGEVVAIYHDNPAVGYVSVRVRLTV